LLVDGGGRPNINQRNAQDGEEETAFERDARSIGEGVVSQYLWSRGLDRVDYLLATHADADHIDGLNDVARNFQVRSAIVAPHAAGRSGVLAVCQDDARDREAVGQNWRGDVLRFGEVSAQVLWPPAGADENAPSRNNDSIMILIRYGDKGFLMTGDIEKEGEAAVSVRDWISAAIW